MGIQGLQTSNESVGVSEATYLNLLKEAITASLYPESSWMVIRKEHRKGIASFVITSFLKRSILEILSSQNFVLVKKRPFDPKVRGNGEDWPMFGYSMIGHRRLENIEYCIKIGAEFGSRRRLRRMRCLERGRVDLRKKCAQFIGRTG